MSLYPYDLRLLNDAPKAKGTEKQAVRFQEGRNVNPLASDKSDEHETSGYHQRIYRRKKRRTFMLIGTLLVIGAIVGGVVGGTFASKNAKSNGSSDGTGPPTVVSPASTSSSGAQAQSTPPPHVSAS